MGGHRKIQITLIWVDFCDVTVCGFLLQATERVFLLWLSDTVFITWYWRNNLSTYSIYRDIGQTFSPPSALQDRFYSLSMKCLYTPVFCIIHSVLPLYFWALPHPFPSPTLCSALRHAVGPVFWHFWHLHTELSICLKRCSILLNCAIWRPTTYNNLKACKLPSVSLLLSLCQIAVVISLVFCQLKKCLAMFLRNSSV